MESEPIEPIEPSEPSNPSKPSKPIEPSKPSKPSKPPSLRELMVANLKVTGVVALLILTAWLTWMGLAALFPETDWLQFPS